MSFDHTLEETWLLAAFDGWNDAGQAATNALRYLVNTYPSQQVRTLSADDFYDFQTTRPVVCHITGKPRIVWPDTAIYLVTLTEHKHLLIPMAAEPNYHWRQYCTQLLRIAEEFEVSRVVTMGSMFADCPHTRALPLDFVERDPYLSADKQQDAHDPDRPIGITTALNISAYDMGFLTNSLWVSVPQYLRDKCCDQGTLQLLQQLGALTHTTLLDDTLCANADNWHREADACCEDNPELAAYLRQLEQEYDLRVQASTIAQHNTPQVRQLLQEAEDYLRHFE